MAQGGFTLGDRLGAKTVDCRVRGCKRTWLDLSSSPTFGGASGKSEGLCDPCKKKVSTLKDLDEPCARTGCTGTWKLDREAQLELFATGRPTPRALCASCEGELAALTPKELACGVPGCERKGVISPRQQLMAAAPGATPETPEAGATGDFLDGPMCDPCADVNRRIQDREVGCGINHCKRNWVWSKSEQMQAFAAGKSSNSPRRMCSPCRENFGSLADRDVRCRASGCKNHWTWVREEQLDACVANKPFPKPPAHLCERCFGIWEKLEDVARPCRHPGCKNTWLDRRGGQLARTLRGKSGEPHQYCEQHTAALGSLEDRQVNCKTDGCDGHWSWTKNQQLAAGVRLELPETANEDAAESGEEPTEVVVLSAANATAATQKATEGGAEATEGGAEATAAGSTAPAAGADAKKKRRRRRRRREIQPPARHCAKCSQFLSSHMTIEIPCAQCATPIFWPPESQLQTDLGNWEAPKLCGACKRDLTEADRQKAREQIRRRIIITTEPHAVMDASSTDNASTAAPTEAAPTEAAPTVEPQTDSGSESN